MRKKRCREKKVVLVVSECILTTWTSPPKAGAARDQGRLSSQCQPLTGLAHANTTKLRNSNRANVGKQKDIKRMICTMLDDIDLRIELVKSMT
jgi:hypothetical protein